MKLISKILMLAVLASAFCSCNKDNEGAPGVYVPKPVSVVISYSYENTADFFSLFDVDITYLDSNGREQKGTLTNNAWKYEATIDYDKAPANYKCKIIARKKGVEPEEGRTYSFMGLGSYVMKVFTINDDNNIYSFGPSVENIKTTTGIRNLSEYLASFSDDGVLVYDYEFSKN